ncbi:MULTISPECIES: hypothetical protein [unclassified Pseudomonas]|uniref:hypothetical protein n=1 Tax=unclassified Pseudomonas TaxID=196821 RepID=UPI0012FD4728|nr:MULTISPECIES: hypothetical protein [unclassified Pseudomonas]MCU1738010.1 hypothetical protein [Pseudomonas sp. 20S_6.2_Bac1]
MNNNLALLVRVRYKDKFQDLHERFFDVTFEQKEIDDDLGQALFANREKLLEAGFVVDVRGITVSRLAEVWSSLRHLETTQQALWQRLERLRWEA